MEAYNLHLRNAAYHCGGLMAVYAAIQRTAMPDVNTGIVERYYASAIQMPALVIGQLSSRSNHHLEKIETGGSPINTARSCRKFPSRWGRPFLLR